MKIHLDAGWPDPPAAADDDGAQRDAHEGVQRDAHDGVPRNAKVLAAKAAESGWAVRVTFGHGELERGRGETKRVEQVRSVAVRLSKGEIRAYGVWVDGGFDNGAAIRPAQGSEGVRGGHIRVRRGYGELVELLDRV